MRILRVSEDGVPVGQFKAQAKKWLAWASQTGQPLVITQTVKIVLTAFERHRLFPDEDLS